MKPIIWVSLLLVLVFCTGMGGVGGYPEGAVPETELRIQATVTDRAGVETDLNQFSMNGQTYLDAWRGQGKLTIPFQHIARLEFGEKSGDEVDAEVHLKSGNVMRLKVSSRALFYGSTGFGAFRIKARNIARITFP